MSSDEKNTNPWWLAVVVAVITAIIGPIIVFWVTQPNAAQSQVVTATPNQIATTTLPSPTAAQVCAIPSLEGMELSAAEELIRQLGLRPVKSAEYNSEIANGLIVFQDPSAGTKLDPCTGDILITVSLGTIPSPTPQPLPSATAEIFLVDQLQIQSNGVVVSSNSNLTQGVKYSLIVQGTYRYDTGEPGEFADAQYREDDNDNWTILNNQFLINGASLQANVADFNNHRYVYHVVGSGEKIIFQIFDLNEDGNPAYADNDGFLQVQIYAGTVP